MPTPSLDAYPAPAHPLEAVTHPDPYPYYAALAAERPLFRDEALGCWVAAGAEVVEAILGDARCRVRPPEEPVPRALLGTAAGTLFGRLVRMNDGGRHRGLRPAVSAALEGPSASAVTAAGRRAVEQARGAMGGVLGPAEGTALLFAIPVLGVAHLVEIPADAQSALPALTGDLVRGFAPGSDEGAATRASAAATALESILEACLPSNASEEGVLGRLARAGAVTGCSRAELVANAVGLLVQAHDATAGLIGNTLVALARATDGVGARVGSAANLLDDPERMEEVAREVLRRDPPVQNTRRFMAAPMTVGSSTLETGDAVLVLLAATGHAFGSARHACPGDTIASGLAASAVSALLAQGLRLDGFVEGLTYRPSVNVRVPVFAGWRFDR